MIYQATQATLSSPFESAAYTYCIFHTFLTEAGCTWHFTLMLLKKKQIFKYPVSNVTKWRQICLCQRQNCLVFHCVTACCHLLDENGDPLRGRIECLCLQRDHCTKAQPYISFDIIVLMQRVMDEHMFHTD